MNLVRDLLDTKVVDRNGREVGRVDSIILEQGADSPPRVVAIEIGLEVLAARLHPVLGRWGKALEVGLGIDEGRPFRAPFTDITVHEHVKVDRAFGETPSAALEKRLRAWLTAIPWRRR